jgi:hypothetical protein
MYTSVSTILDLVVRQDRTGQRGEERVKEHRNDWEGQEWTGQDRIGL